MIEKNRPTKLLRTSGPGTPYSLETKKLNGIKLLTEKNLSFFLQVVKKSELLAIKIYTEKQS
jgi:hypothetical protein